MQKILSVLDEMQKMNDAYEISTKSIIELKNEIATAKVCTPIIGKFSSGKSALVNTILGYSKKILREDITPETAVPAEILYSDSEDYITIIKNDGGYETISVDDYRNYEADATKIKCARLHLRNSFMEKIPDVMIVDMPGFESGFEIHNQAIDNYLPQSLAYIVAFPADDMIVRSSIGNILTELCLNNMPFCVVITKYDKRNDDFDKTFTKMKENLKRFVKGGEIQYCRTSSFTGDAEEVEAFLIKIQEKSQEIFANKYILHTMTIMETTENYLKTALKHSQLSESELNEQEEKLQKKLAGLDAKFSKEQEGFQLEISECVEIIKNDVQCAMQSEESALVAMVINNQSINNQLNMIVRNAVTISIKKRFIPKVEKYLNRVSNFINSDSIGDVHIFFSFDTDKLDKDITSPVVAVVAGVLLEIPILGILAGIFIKLLGDKKREEAKQQIRMKLQNEVFPQVLREVASGIEMTITKQIKMVNHSMQEEINNQRNALEKAMADVKGKINDEKTKKDNMAMDMKADLERIGEMKDGLR